MICENLWIFLNKLIEKGLVTEYYRCSSFSICRVADWSLMAFSSSVDTKEEHDTDFYTTLSSTCYAWHIDKEFAEKIMANNALFNATLSSKKESREPDLVLWDFDDPKYAPPETKHYLALLEEIRNNVKSGTLETMIDSDLEIILKKHVIGNIEKYVEEYGNPPVFSKKKKWLAYLLCLLYPLGLPWFYIGKPIIGAAMLAGVILGGLLVFLLIPVVVVEVILVFIFFFKLLGNTIRDKEGRIILSKKEQNRIAKEIERYNKYCADIKDTVD